MAAGVFTATSLGRVKLQVDDVWKRSPEIDDNQIARAILENQTANFQAIMAGGACRGAQVNYIIDCANAIVDCSTIDLTGCDWGGAEVESATADLDIDQCVADQFNINKAECNDNQVTYERIFAQRLANGLKRIQENLAVATGVFLDANVQTPGTVKYGGVTGDYINFNSIDWENLALLSKIMYDVRQEGVDNGIGISTGLLWAAQDLNRRKSGGFGVYNDPTSGVNIYYDKKFAQLETALAKEAFIVFDPNKVAFWTYNFEESDVWLAKGHDDQFSMRYRLPDLVYMNGGSAQPIYVDLHRKRVCNDTLSGWTDKFISRLQFGFASAPDICATGDTGIVGFGVSDLLDPITCDPCPAPAATT